MFVLPRSQDIDRLIDISLHSIEVSGGKQNVVLIPLSDFRFLKLVLKFKKPVVCLWIDVADFFPVGDNSWPNCR